jgi:hypothetical protein
MSSLESWSWSLLLVVVLPAAAVAGALLVRRAIGADLLAGITRVGPEAFEQVQEIFDRVPQPHGESSP